MTTWSGDWNYATQNPSSPWRCPHCDHAGWVTGFLSDVSDDDGTQACVYECPSCLCVYSWADIHGKWDPK